MITSLFIFTLCLPYHFHPVYWDQTMIMACQSLGSKPILVQELFTPVPRLFGTTSRCLSAQPFQLLPSRNIWRHISLTWPFPHRHWHARWPVDVTELFLWFCCWTLIRLSHHWVWLCQGYWPYRSLIDWLIDKHYYLIILLLSCLTFGGKPIWNKRITFAWRILTEAVSPVRNYNIYVTVASINFA